MSVWKAFFITGVYCVITFLVYSILIIPKHFYHYANNQTYWIFVNIITQFLSYLLISKLYIGKSFDLDKDKIVNIKILSFLILIMFGLLIVEQPILDLQNDIFNPDYNFQFIPANRFPVLFIILRFVKACIFAPIIEELFFRRFIQNKLNQKYSFPVSLIIASSLFAIYHFELGNLLPSFILGLIMGYIYYKTKNIKYSIIFHASSNFVVYFINFFGGNLIALTIKHKYDLPYWLIIIVGLLILYLGIKLFKKYIEEDGEILIKN